MSLLILAWRTSSAYRKSSCELKSGHQGSMKVGRRRWVNSEPYSSRPQTLARFRLLGWYSVRILSVVAPLVASASGAASVTLEGEAALKLDAKERSWRKSNHSKGVPDLRPPVDTGAPWDQPEKHQDHCLCLPTQTRQELGGKGLVKSAMDPARCDAPLNCSYNFFLISRSYSLNPSAALSSRSHFLRCAEIAEGWNPPQQIGQTRFVAASFFEALGISDRRRKSVWYGVTCSWKQKGTWEDVA
jgi:hypothetical protein